MDLPFTGDPAERVYLQRLDRLYQEGQSGHPPVF